MIFVSGIHGVGKTYFCTMIKKQLNISSYSASELISKRGKKKLSSDKRTSEIALNQIYLEEAINELNKDSKKFILDGHFCLLDSDQKISRIPREVFFTLKPDLIVLLKEKSFVIAARRLQRDGVVVDEDFISTFQQEEEIYAKEIANQLEINLLVSYGSNDLEGIIEKIREEVL